VSTSEFVVSTERRPIVADTTASSPTGRRLDRQRMQRTSIPLMLPAAILLVVLFVGPIIYSFYLGFTNLKLVGPTARHHRFTGLDNVNRLIGDRVFHQSLSLTAIFVIGSGVLLTTIVALALAIAMEKALTVTSGVVGIVVMIAYMIPPVTIAITWVAAGTPGGAVTRLFGNSDADLLNNHPMMLVSGANAWSLTGLAMLLFSAALRNIPSDIVEAAQLENANAVQRFVKITLPLLKPTIVTTVLLISLMSLANFTIIYLMTGGGPGSDTMILPVYSYQQGFFFNDLAYGALIGNVTVIIATVVSALFVYFSRPKAGK
jgi:multiple sugar transport system permease protein